MLHGNFEFCPSSTELRHIYWFGSLCPDAAGIQENSSWDSWGKWNKYKSLHYIKIFSYVYKSSYWKPHFVLVLPMALWPPLKLCLWLGYGRLELEANWKSLAKDRINHNCSPAFWLCHQQILFIINLFYVQDKIKDECHAFVCIQLSDKGNSLILKLIPLPIIETKIAIFFLK